MKKYYNLLLLPVLAVAVLLLQGVLLVLGIGRAIYEVGYFYIKGREDE